MRLMVTLLHKIDLHVFIKDIISFNMNKHLNNVWFLDSEKYEHSCTNANQLKQATLTKRDSTEFVNGFIMWNKSDTEVIEVPIKNVHVQTHESRNILSIQVLLSKGFNIKYTSDRCEIYYKEEIILEAQRQGDDYIINAGNTINQAKGFVIKEEPDNLKEFECITKNPEDLNDISTLSLAEQNLWNREMEKEMRILLDSGVMEECRPKPNSHVIKSRWTYSVKYDDNNKINNIRARLVAKGCGQVPGVDYTDTFAPVVNQVTIRILLTIAIYQKLIVNHCDVSSAFLYGELDEIIYMRTPENESNDTSKVFQLKKAMYGLKQAARSWNNKIDNTLKRIGFDNNLVDPCLYILHKSICVIYVLIHVDDLLIASQDITIIREIIEQLREEYKIKDLGKVHQYLGINIEHDAQDSEYYIHQSPMIKRLIDKYQLSMCKIANTPMATDYQQSRMTELSNELPTNKHYQQAIGSLLYIGNVSRPDIHLAVNLLSRHTSKPTRLDWESVKRVIRYLKGTINHKLRIGGGNINILKSYCDADWGGDLANRKSTNGTLHFLGDTLISWKTTRQKSVALSTAEAEFVAAAVAGQNICWIKELLNEMQINIVLPVSLLTDSQSGLHMAEAQKCTRRAKHIDIKYFYIQELIKNGCINLLYCPTEEMLADMLTKPLSKPLFDNCVRNLGLITEPLRESS